MNRANLVVTFLKRKNCSLCDKAMEKLQIVQKKQPFELKEVNVDVAHYRVWARRYMFDVPVALVDGKEIFRHHCDTDRTLRALQKERARLDKIHAALKGHESILSQKDKETVLSRRNVIDHDIKTTPIEETSEEVRAHLTPEQLALEDKN
mmetsp:Transcript_1279/g.1446  ORF Transcript_1279/g.1446 Transcript_1279/m.1446 type:complete len:150 (-) Transcript_1279:229-678(-)